MAYSKNDTKLNRINAKGLQKLHGAFAIAHTLLKAISLFWLNRTLIWLEADSQAYINC